MQYLLRGQRIEYTFELNINKVFSKKETMESLAWN